jgi:Zn-dependent metalloprotease
MSRVRPEVPRRPTQVFRNGTHVVRGVLASGVLLAVVMAGGPGSNAAFGASTPGPSPTLSRAQRIAAEQAGADSAARALGLGMGEKLVVKDVITDADGTTHVRYNRTFNGLRVIGGDLVSHRDKSGKIKGVSWNGSHTVAVASTKPKTSMASAYAAGTRKASLVQQRSAATQSGELVVYSGAGSGGVSGKAIPGAAPKLAYDVMTDGVRADQTPSRLHTIVDATTGGTLSSFDEIGRGTGSGLYVGSVNIGTTGAGSSWSMTDAEGNRTTDLNGLGNGSGNDIPNVPGTTFTDADNIWGNGTNTDRASAGVDAQYGAEQTFEYFKNVLGRNGIWNTGVGARSRVHYGNNYVNAFWDGTQMTYGDGAGNASPLVEIDVAGHEMTHGVTENTAGLIGEGEAGGLNEATSDIFGTAVEWYANNASDTPDYLLGEKINIGGRGPLRYMDRPSKDGASRDCWSPTLGTIDVHYSSGPLNHWFYLASEGSGPKVLNGISYDSPTCNGSTVTPIGRDKAEKIWYRTLTTYLTSGSDYAAARDGAIQSAKDLYGDASAECTGIAASFSAIAVPAGAVTCGITPPPPPGNNLLRNPGFESGDTLWSATPAVIDQWGSALPAQPAHSGTWSAWLGGYGTTHSDSIGQLVTIPANGSARLSYYVHIETLEARGSPAYDTMTVRSGSTVLQTLSNINAAGGYQFKTVDLSAYAGQTISLSFSGLEDSSAATSFVLDDLSVTTPAALTRLSDFNKDGSTDLVVRDAAGTLWLYPGNGAGSYLARRQMGTGWNVMTAILTPGDVTGDGNADLFARDTAGRLWLYPGNGASGVSARRLIGGGWQTYTITNAADMNGAGRPDLLARDSAGVLWLYPFSGNSVMGTRTRISAGWNGYTIRGPGDLSGDGQADILARDPAGSLWLYRGNGTGGVTARTLVGNGWAGMNALVTPGNWDRTGGNDTLARDSAGSLWLYPGNNAGGLAARRLIGGGWNGYTIS